MRKATKDANPKAATIGTANIRLLLMNPPNRSERKVVGSKVAAATRLLELLLVVSRKRSRGAAWSEDDDVDGPMLVVERRMEGEMLVLGTNASAVRAMLPMRQQSRKNLWTLII